MFYKYLSRNITESVENLLIGNEQNIWYRKYVLVDILTTFGTC